MGASAIVVILPAIAASNAAGAAARRAQQKKECAASMPLFKDAGATDAQRQHYASCVDLMTPIRAHVSVIEGALIVGVCLVLVCAAAVLLTSERN